MLNRNLTTAELIELAIKNEEWARANASAGDLHFWDGWDADAVRAGHLVATVTTSAPGLGYKVIVTSCLVVKLADGTSVATVPDTEDVHRVDSRQVRREAGSLAQYAVKRAHKLYGTAYPVKTKHHA